jgi:hypothetical protein
LFYLFIVDIINLIFFSKLSNISILFIKSFVRRSS